MAAANANRHIWRHVLTAVAAAAAVLTLLAAGLFALLWCVMDLGDRAPAHEPFISAYRRHADVITQADSLFLDNEQDAQRALQGHGPDISATKSNGQMRDVIDLINMWTNGYFIWFGPPRQYGDDAKYISVGMEKKGTQDNEYIYVNVYAHKAETDPDYKPHLQQYLGMTDRQAEDMASQAVHTALDTAGKNWPE